MAPRDTKREAFEAGLRNPLMGDIGPLQRLYGTVSAIGSELGGGDMGTPFGQRFAESQKATKAEIKRLQALREKHPEEFGRGMMQAQEQMDPYMLGLGLGSTGAMMPRGGTTFSPAGGPAPIRALEGPGEMRALPAPIQEVAPAAPYYRNVPPEMGTSMRPMTPFQQNQVGLSTGRFGMQGYAPEMAVTDFESYGPMGARTAPGPYAPSGFDRNMLAAYRQGRYNRMAGGRPAPMGGDYTLEELGSAPVPYRQGGLVYEPGGPQARPGYGGSMDFGVTRDGQAVSPTGMRFDPRLATAFIGGGAGYMAGRGREMGPLPAFNPNIPVSGERMGMSQMYPVMPMGATALSGQLPGAGAAFEQPAAPTGRTPSRKAEGGKAGGKGVPMPPKRPGDLTVEAPFDPNLNYLVTEALDRLLGGGEAERGRQFEQYYAMQPWPY